ncbi:MAG: M23 family metallopeptidase [Candidatus Acidiferrales bacterium]
MKTNSRLLLAVLLFTSAFPMRAFAQDASAEKGIEGTWEGVLGGQLHLVVTFTKSPNGAYTGQLNSVDQNAILPIETATLKGDAVRFEVQRVGGIYEGLLSADGVLRGTWAQTGLPPQPLSFTRSQKAEASKPAPAATPAHTPKPLTVPLDVVVPIAPTAFQADGKWHVVYELHVTNLGRWDTSLTRVELFTAGSTQKSLVKLEGADLEAVLVRPGTDTTEKSKIAPGAFAVVYLWLTLDKREDVPDSIRQRITTRIGDYPEQLAIDTAPTAVDRRTVAMISSPLRGDAWVAANGPSNSSAHRRALIPIDGRAYISQRFAIDWVELFPDGKTHRGDPLDNKNYRAYGAEIHAVSDGIVTDAKDGIAQNIPGANSRAVPITLETIGGNHVIMEIAPGQFAFYAHMQQGSVRVKVGDKVRRGDVLGLVGNSGNSTEPHLHFHISNSNSMLGSEGLPYALDSFEARLSGSANSTTAPSTATAKSNSSPTRHATELPTENEIVSFAP